MRLRPVRRYRRGMRTTLALFLLFFTGCSAAETSATAGCADVVEVQFEGLGGRTFRFAVSVESADTGWDKYADEWQVRDSGGRVLGTRTLTHPHVDEQPFTRSHEIFVEPGISDVIVAARDSVDGYCGSVVVVSIP